MNAAAVYLGFCRFRIHGGLFFFFCKVFNISRRLAWGDGRANGRENGSSWQQRVSGVIMKAAENTPRGPGHSIGPCPQGTRVHTNNASAIHRHGHTNERTKKPPRNYSTASKRPRKGGWGVGGGMPRGPLFNGISNTGRKRISGKF